MKKNQKNWSNSMSIREFLEGNGQVKKESFKDIHDSFVDEVISQFEEQSGNPELLDQEIDLFRSQLISALREIETRVDLPPRDAGKFSRMADALENI